MGSNHENWGDEEVTVGFPLGFQTIQDLGALEMGLMGWEHKNEEGFEGSQIGDSEVARLALGHGPKGCEGNLPGEFLERSQSGT
jgi:hypothetical protein